MEECDGDGAGTPGETATCDTDCTDVVCGDGVVNTTASETCDDSGESASCDDDCTDVVCGDGTTNATAGEDCDDGNTTNGDGCDSTCALEDNGDDDGGCCGTASDSDRDSAALLTILIALAWLSRRRRTVPS